jgi:hypothetical protein
MKMNVRPMIHRGYHTVEKKMYSAQALKQKGVRLLPDGKWENDEDFIMMQFVWREDSIGTPIFENDIVDVDVKTEVGLIRVRGVMMFDAEANGFQVKIQSQQAGNGVATNMLVIGDVMQHPELVKETPELPQ